MEICWMYAVAVFLTSTLKSRIFPFAGAVIIFAVSALLMRLTNGKGFRKIILIIFHTLAFSITAIVTLYITYYSSDQLQGIDKIIIIFTAARSAVEWLVFLIIVLWCILFWIGGSAASGRIINHYSICSRFDLGIAMFFFLFIFKLLIYVKGGIQINDAALSCVFPFFITGLTSLGILKAKKKSAAFLSGYHGTGTVAGIAVAILLCIAIIFFLMPLFTQIADTGYGILKQGADFVIPSINNFLRFILSPPRVNQIPSENSSATGTDLKIKPETNIGIVDIIIVWFFKIIIPVLIIFITGFLFYYLFKWMFSRTSIINPVEKKTKSSFQWLFKLLYFFIFIFGLIFKKIRGFNKASEFYQMLLLWGHRSGTSKYLNETPLEYGNRLKTGFPHLEYEIKLIINAFNTEVYAGVNPDQKIIADTRSAWKKLRNPLNWPARLGNLIFRNDY